MYSDHRLALERQRTLLTRAQKRRQVSQLQAYRRASRRAARAQDRLSRAQCDVWRMRTELDAG
jgi:hypothetical protein